MYYHNLCSTVTKVSKYFSGEEFTRPSLCIYIAGWLLASLLYSTVAMYTHGSILIF